MGAIFGYAKHLFFKIFWRKEKNQAGQKAVRMTALQRKELFIEDICDGDRRKAKALIDEKLKMSGNLSYPEAVNLVYLDVLAIAAYHQR